MYANTGYLNDLDIEIEAQDHPLLVSGCGIYRLIHRPDMTTIRPEGRKDYQLLYISSGRAFFYLKDGKKEISEGHMVLYRPGENQHYSYYAEDNPEVCWVHFSGSETDTLLDKIGFGSSQILYCGQSFNCFELFRSIILELQLKRPCFEELLCLYLRQLFVGIQRTQLAFSTEKYLSRHELEATVHYFNESFSQNICIEEYAKNQHMSVCWFIRSFKRYMGVTPMQYITSIRMNKAKELLKNTNYSIQEISGLVGYENPLYFSRIFKKQIGCPPSGYRKA
ncbi:MAG: AraC family transcriptional regulator [Clostridium sp.]|nr:AraC family transcriptional regulator [Clostridium sp.]